MDVLYAQKRRVRSPVGAGIFYPDNKGELQELLRSFGINYAGFGYAKAIIAPHGAWNYSGSIAADAFSSAMGRSGSIKRVVILGPIHAPQPSLTTCESSEEGSPLIKREKGLFLSNSYSFYTPIGNILVDRKMTKLFEKSGISFEINDIPHLVEHSIEILLPFIKYCFPGASIVPILMGQPTAQHIFDLAQALGTIITPSVLEETLIVVSCNLSSNKDENAARILAEESLRLIKEMNSSALASAVLEDRLNACGGALIVSLLESGLLQKTSCSAVNDCVSAVTIENNTVYYSGLSFI